MSPDLGTSTDTAQVDLIFNTAPNHFCDTLVSQSLWFWSNLVNIVPTDNTYSHTNFSRAIIRSISHAPIVHTLAFLVSMSDIHCTSCL